MTTKLYSYRDVFHDGAEKLHPAFKLGGVLLVLTNTRPKHTLSVVIKASSVESKHFRQGRNSYLTVAYKQQATKFNENSGGVIKLSPKDIALVEATFGLTVNPTKNFSKRGRGQISTIKSSRMFKIEVHTDGTRKVTVLDSTSNGNFEKAFGKDGLQKVFGIKTAAPNLTNWYTGTGRAIPKDGPVASHSNPSVLIDFFNDVATGRYATSSTKLLEDCSNYVVAVAQQIFNTFGPGIETKADVVLKDLVTKATEGKTSEENYTLVVAACEQILALQSEDNDTAGLAALELGTILNFDATALVPIVDAAETTQTVAEATETPAEPIIPPAEKPTVVTQPSDMTNILEAYRGSLRKFQALSVLAGISVTESLDSLNECETALGLPTTTSEGLTALPATVPAEPAEEAA